MSPDPNAELGDSVVAVFPAGREPPARTEVPGQRSWLVLCTAQGAPIRQFVTLPWGETPPRVALYGSFAGTEPPRVPRVFLWTLSEHDAEQSTFFYHEAEMLLLDDDAGAEPPTVVDRPVTP